MIDFVKTIFGVEVEKLTYGLIVDYFATPKTENTNLEFKSAKGGTKLPDNIFQAICAMLNSEGGLVIWGAPTEKPNNGVKECIGELTPFNAQLKCTDLARSISDSIHPIPNGIEIYEIDDEDQRYVYLFQIQKSEYSPHQTDNRYYMRLDTETRIAPHYFIEALFKRIKYPNLSGELEFTNITYVEKTYEYVLIQFKATIRNNSPLQNEEYPEILVSSNAGKLLEPHEAWPPRNEFPRVDPIKRLEILYYGKKIERTFKLGLLHDHLIQFKAKKMKLNLLLRFGGRFSPLKFSFYAIDTSFFSKDLYCDNQSYPIPNEKIEFFENKLVADSEIDMDSISDWDSIQG